MNAHTKRLRTLTKARRSERDRRVRALAPQINKITRRTEDRILAIVNRAEGGGEGAVFSAAIAWNASAESLADLMEVFLQDMWDWSYESAGAAFVRALPWRYWLVKTAPIGRLAVAEAVGGHPAAVGVLEELDWNEQYEHIISGQASPAEARELVRQFEFPPPSREQVDTILQRTNAADGLSAMQRIRTVEDARLGDLESLIRDSFTAQAQGKASAVEYLAPRLRVLVGNDPGKSTGMNYRAKRIARTEGVRIAEDGLREVWQQAGDIVDGVQWFSAKVLLSRWVDHEERDGKIYPLAELPMIPAGPNCLCWSSPVLADDLTKGLPPENLGAWYDPSVLRAEKERAPKKRKAKKKTSPKPPKPAQRWINKLSPAETEAAKLWGSSAYRDIRNAQRFGTDDAEIKETVAALERATNKAPRFRDTAWRGLSDLPPEAEESLKNAKTIRFDAFTSASGNRDSAAKFAFPDDTTNASVMLELRSKTGRDITGVMPLGGESEVLFRKGSKFRVLSVRSSEFAAYDERFKATHLVLQEI